jgi:hypothetical protein
VQVAAGEPMMFARIGVMRALSRGVERVFNPDRKDPHWGKRKLKRDRFGSRYARFVFSKHFYAQVGNIMKTNANVWSNVSAI